MKHEIEDEMLQNTVIKALGLRSDALTLRAPVCNSKIRHGQPESNLLESKPIDPDNKSEPRPRRRKSALKNQSKGDQAADNRSAEDPDYRKKLLPRHSHSTLLAEVLRKVRFEVL